SDCIELLLLDWPPLLGFIESLRCELWRGRLLAGSRIYLKGTDTVLADWLSRHPTDDDDDSDLDDVAFVPRRAVYLVCYRPLCSGKASSSSCCTKSHVGTTSTCYLFCIIISDPSSQSSAILYDLISLLRDARHIQARRRRR